MEVHISNRNQAGKGFKKKKKSIHFYQINAKVLQSTQRAKDYRVRNTSTLRSHGKSAPELVINA